MMHPILRVFMEGGILDVAAGARSSFVLCGIAFRALRHLFFAGGNDVNAIQSCLDGLLFWGGFAVVIGVLGSAIGYHRAMSAIVARGLVNPRALWIGTAEGLVTFDCRPADSVRRRRGLVPPPAAVPQGPDPGEVTERTLSFFHEARSLPSIVRPGTVG